MKYGRYEILRELGKGAMGMVYLAHDPNINREVALKILRPDRVESADFVQRFLKEARAIGRLTHPNIVTVYDVGEDQGTVFIAMELLEGKPLNVYARDNSLSIEDISDIGIQVASSLDYAHSKGIVHRDIKPPNIMITSERQVKITDFGIAHIEDPDAAQQTQAGEILGTPNYMSPEQVLGKKVDGRSDLFSLGVILYELACGVKPFKGENLGSIFNAITSSEPSIPSEITPEIPKPFSDIVMKSLAKEPSFRFSTGREMADALAETIKKPKDDLSGTAKQPSAKKWGILAGILALAIVLVFAVVFTGKKKDIETRAVSSKEPVAEAVLEIDSEPSGAQIFVDGQIKGSSPVKIRLPVGRHEVRLSMPGYYEWEAEISLSAQGQRLPMVELVPVEETPAPQGVD